MCQRDLVLRHLRERGSITPLEAYAEYGIMRLGARIWELRQRGYRIESGYVQEKTEKTEEKET